LGTKGIDIGMVGAWPSLVILARFCDFVVCWVKNKNHGFGKVSGHKPHKCLQSDVGKLWVQKELILPWLVLSQVW